MCLAIHNGAELKHIRILCVSFQNERNFSDRTLHECDQHSDAAA